MMMPFGKYKGKPLSQLPEDYLLWLYEALELREPLRSAVHREVERRFPLTTKTPADEVKYVAREIIATGYRTLALKRHPDKGGSHQEMLVLNHAHEWLKERAA